MSFDRGQKRNMRKFVRSEGTVQGVSLLFVCKNLVTTHYAVKRGDEKHSRTAYMIRAKLYKGNYDDGAIL